MTIADKPRRPRWIMGCLWIIAVIAIIYVGNAAWLLIPNMINRAKWERQSITDYEFQYEVSGCECIFGDWKKVVNNDMVVEVQHEKCEEGKCDPTRFNDTLEESFDIPALCLWYFPLQNCSYRYNAEYGYPAQINQSGCNWPMLVSDCGINIEIIDFTPLDKLP